MANFSGPTFQFADESPVRSGRKHRRGRGYTTSKSGNNSKQASSNRNNHGSQSGGQGGYNSGQHSQQTQYYTADWDVNQSNGRNNKDPDNNSCTGSLTYSASSSVQSGMSSGGESSNDSSFADIIKLIDSEGEGASEIKAFIAARTEAANSEGVTGWMQGVEARAREKQLQQQKRHSSKQGKRQSASSNVDFNYSRDDSDDEYFTDKKLETITGQDDEAPRRTNVTVTSRSQADPYQSRSKIKTSYNDNISVSTPRTSTYGGAVTPPPNSRHKRTSTPPNLFAPATISRSNSHRSKSSSDGSWDTPTKSPPHSSSYSKPPQASTTRRVGKGSSPRSSGSSSVNDVGDVSEAVYTKFWMCGFTDSINFDRFDKK